MSDVDVTMTYDLLVLFVFHFVCFEIHLLNLNLNYLLISNYINYVFFLHLIIHYFISSNNI